MDCEQSTRAENMMIKWHYVRGLEKSSDGWKGVGELDLYRASIPGGWLVTGIDGRTNTGCAPTFVPDLDHTWDGTSTDYDRKVDG